MGFQHKPIPSWAIYTVRVGFLKSSIYVAATSHLMMVHQVQRRREKFLALYNQVKYNNIIRYN